MKDEDPSAEPDIPKDAGVFALFSRTDVRIWTVVMILGCVGIVWVYAPAEWSFAMKTAGGVTIGVIAMFSVFVPRMIGGDGFI